jgi:hypothetical protein
MSSFNCEKCGKPILDAPGTGYYTECEHYPLNGKLKTKSPEQLKWEEKFDRLWSETWLLDGCKAMDGKTESRELVKRFILTAQNSKLDEAIGEINKYPDYIDTTLPSVKNILNILNKLKQ